MSGKGSGRRPTDEEKYMSNWDNIFGKKEKQNGNVPVSSNKEQEQRPSKSAM